MTPDAASEQAHRSRIAELVALNRLAIALSETRDPDTVLDVGLREAVAGLGFGRGLIALVDEDARELHDARTVGVPPEAATTVASLRVPLADEVSLLTTLVRASGPLLFHDLDTDPYEPNRRLAAALDSRDAAGTPLVTQGRTVGVLVVDDRRAGRPVEPSDGPVLYTVGNLLAGALETARLTRTLEARVEARTRELVDAMTEAQQARAAAEAANAAKSTFLSAASHELRTPLTSVVGFAKLTRKRFEEVVLPVVPVGEPKVDRAARQIGDNLAIVVAEGERLTGLINDLLDLAKIESGRMEFRMAPVSIGEVVDQALAATAALFEVKGLALARDVAPALSTVTGDRDRLVQVVVNLVSNAVKFTPEGGTVACRVREEGGALVVSVTDTGAGIDPADHERIFEPFRQAGDRLPDGPQGTGLGLPISKEIVEAHGGRLWVESRLGAGSTFSFGLPVRPGGTP